MSVAKGSREKDNVFSMHGGLALLRRHVVDRDGACVLLRLLPHHMHGVRGLTKPRYIREGREELLQHVSVMAKCPFIMPASNRRPAWPASGSSRARSRHEWK